MLIRASRCNRATATSRQSLRRPTVRRAQVPRRSICLSRSPRGFTDKSVAHVESSANASGMSFEWTPENWEKAQQIIAKYPPNYQASATGPLLDLAQRQCGGWLPLAAMNKVAELLKIPPMKVYEVASFYSMFNRTPIGKNFVQVCGTVPCHLVGAHDIVTALKKRLNINKGETTPDNMFTLVEVECLGACVNAPVMQINDDYYEDLTPETAVKVIDELAAGRTPKPGPQRPDRRVAEPVGGPTTLLEPPMGPYAPYLEKLDKEAAANTAASK